MPRERNTRSGITQAESGKNSNISIYKALVTVVSGGQTFRSGDIVTVKLSDADIKEFLNLGIIERTEG